MENLAETLTRTANTLTGFGSCAGEVQGLDDERLLVAQGHVASVRRAVDAYAVTVAAEIARRSRREFGYAGLAQRNGFKSAELLIQALGQSSYKDAAKLVAVGTMLATEEAEADAQGADESSDGRTSERGTAQGGDGGDGDGDGAGDGDGDGDGDGVESPESQLEVSVPALVSWRAPIAAAVTEGTLSAEAAEAIRRPLNEIAERVSADRLREGAAALVADAVACAGAGVLSVEELAKRARRMRDRLDADGVAAREANRRERRMVKTWWDDEGMFHLFGLLDPENGLLVHSAIATVLSPRTGGPRFVDKAEQERAQRLIEDPRTNEQIAADALVEMVRIAAEATESTVFGSRRPSVRLIVPIETLRTGHGSGFFQDHADAISAATAERHACTDGCLSVVCGLNGDPLNVARTRRLFTERQRIALGVRDGACRWPGCSVESWKCEAHHINHWHHDHGQTDLADGTLLCKSHHMVLHDNGWKILREQSTYWLRPPTSVDPDQAVLAMPSKTAPIAALQPRRTG